MARKLSFTEELDLLSKIKHLAKSFNHPTTALQISKKLGLKYSDPVERISLKYSVDNILHGPEATRYNKQLGAQISNESKLNKLKPEFERLVSSGMKLIDIQESMGLGLDHFCSLCRFCSIDESIFLEQYSIQNDIAVRTDDEGKQLRAERVKRKHLSDKQERWKVKCLNACCQLDNEGIPKTLKQIERIANCVIPKDILPYLEQNLPGLIIGPEADRIDKQLKHERYSAANKESWDRTYETMKQTIKRRYGVDSYLQTDEFQEKAKKTKLEKYGSETFTNREKAIRTLMKSHGVTNVHQIPEVIAKSLKTWNERYGDTNLAGSKKLKDKIRKNTFDKYGVEYPCLTTQCVAHRRICYCYDDVTFDSSYELCYYIWCQDNSIKLTRYQGPGLLFTYKGRNHRYFPDFIQQDNKYVEIKGAQFLNSKGVLENPYSDDPEVQKLWKAKHKFMIELGVEMISDCQMYIDYVNDKYTLDYIPLFRRDLEFPYYDTLPAKTNYRDLIRYFHRSIYSARLEKHISPLEGWNDKNLVKDSALNRLKYVGKCTPHDIITGFNVAKIAPKVSVFSGHYASVLIDKYLSDATQIFDPFSGFSGRMLGAYDHNIMYIGRDLLECHVQESNQIIQYLEAQNLLSVTQQNIFDSKDESFDTLFTCPPYNMKEIWIDTQVNLSCDQWIDECLSRFKCRKYLFVVDDTIRYSNYIVETKKNRSHFGCNMEKVILIHSA